MLRDSLTHTHTRAHTHTHTRASETSGHFIHDEKRDRKDDRKESVDRSERRGKGVKYRAIEQRECVCM